MAKDLTDLQSGVGGWQKPDLQKDLGVTGDFKDHFSIQSEGYAKHRPGYPAELFEFLAMLCDPRSHAWDCATGNGQAAIALAQHFDSVIATDASEAQIQAAAEHAQIDFRVATAERSGLPDQHMDLITVGQAFHWFDDVRFLAEVRRVAKPNGVLAIWCYELCEVNVTCDAIIDTLYSDIVDEFWPPERVIVEQGYAKVTMPGEIIPVPNFVMSLQWRAAEMLGYLRTWSACRYYESENGSDPVADIEAELLEAWGQGERRVTWPLKIRVSRVNTLLE